MSLPWFKPVLPAIDRQGEVERYCQAKSPNPNSQVLSLKGLVLADNKINLTLNSIVNKTMHELYFHQVVIFWIKYNEAPAELFIIYLKCWI